MQFLSLKITRWAPLNVAPLHYCINDQQSKVVYPVVFICNIRNGLQRTGVVMLMTWIPISNGALSCSINGPLNRISSIQCFPSPASTITMGSRDFHGTAKGWEFSVKLVIIIQMWVVANPSVLCWEIGSRSCSLSLWSCVGIVPENAPGGAAITLTNVSDGSNCCNAEHAWGQRWMCLRARFYLKATLNLLESPLNPCTMHRGSRREANASNPAHHKSRMCVSTFAS